MGDRVILHCDLNCFFASVELLQYPALRDVPVAVCGDPESRHGIILAKNEPRLPSLYATMYSNYYPEPSLPIRLSLNCHLYTLFRLSP